MTVAVSPSIATLIACGLAALPAPPVLIHLNSWRTSRTQVVGCACPSEPTCSSRSGFRPPSTPDGISRLRLTASAGISDDDLALSCKLIGTVVP